MSREIKFRAWDDDVEHMFYSDKPEDDYWFSFEDGKLKGYALREPRGGADPMEPPEPYCDEFEVMEFTGLLDKNGIEIYEGDICEITRMDNGNKEIRLIHYSQEDCSFCFGVYRVTLNLKPEVIGNIHEKSTE